jgi:hypothetical protein
MRRLAPPLVLAAVVLAAFGRLVLRPGGLIVDGDRPAYQQHERRADAAPGNDLTRLFLPHHLRLARAASPAGGPPAWDPAGFGGRPLVGNPQAGLWYPPVWLVWRTGAPALLGWLTAAHLVLAAIGAWRLGRDAGLGTAAATVAGGSFALGPYLLGHVAAGHVPHVWAVSWYPWAFLAARRARAGSWRGAAGLAAAWAACALAGHPQQAILLGLALGGWWCADAVRRSWRPSGSSTPDGPAPRGWRPAVVLLVLALTTALTAVEWLPDRAVAPWGREAGRSPSWGELGQCRVRLVGLLQLASPRALGGPADYVGRDNQWEACLAFGLVVLGLAAVGAMAGERLGEVRGWLALAAGSLLFAAGPPLGLHAALTALLPPLGALRAPGRGLFLTTLAVAMLAGMGVEALATGGGRRRPAAIVRASHRAVLGLVLVVLAGALAGLAIGPGLAADPGADAIGRPLPRPAWAVALLGCRNLAGDPVALLALAGMAAGMAWWGRAASPRRAASAIATLALAELVAWGVLSLPVAPASRFLAPDPIARRLGDRPPPSRELGPRIHAREDVLPGLRTVDAAPDRTELYDRFQIRHAAALYEPLYALRDGPRPREAADPALSRRNAAIRRAVLDRLAVVAIVHDRPELPLDWPRVAGAAGASRWVFAHPDPLPRAYVVPRAAVHPDAEAVARLPDVPAREAAILAADPLAGRAGPRQPFTPARIARPRADRLRVAVRTQAPGLLVVAETWMPGWSAVDGEGRPVPLLRGNGAQIVVPLPTPGDRVIRFRYDAPGLVPGLVLTGLGGVAALATALFGPLVQTQPRRLRTTHSAPRSPAKSSRKGQLSHSRTSR